MGIRFIYTLLLVTVTAVWGWTFVVVQDAIALYGVLPFLAARFSLAGAARPPLHAARPPRPARRRPVVRTRTGRLRPLRRAAVSARPSLPRRRRPRPDLRGEAHAPL